MKRRRSNALTAWGTRKELPERLEDYLRSCAEAKEGEGRRASTRLPNLAGFCRFLGCGMSDMEGLREVDRLLFDRICAVLEDELLNHAPSPTLLNAYLKKRLGYGEERGAEGVETECGPMRLVFEHDIEVDGA